MGLFSSKKETHTDEKKDLITKVEILIQAVERVYPSTLKLMYRNFLSGVFFSLGTTIGLSIVIGLFTFIVTQLGHLPILNRFIEKTAVEQILPTPTLTPTPTPTLTLTPTLTPTPTAFDR